MPLYRIVPVDDSAAPVEISARDGASALHIAGQLGCQEADVWQDGQYAFSVRRQGGQASFWQIFERQSDPLAFAEQVRPA